MPVDLEADLAALAAALMRDSSPITLDELAGAAHNTQANGEAPPVALIDTRPVAPRGRRWVAAVSVATAAAAVGAIALVGVRDDGPAPAGGGDGALQVDGMLMLDADSVRAEGWQLTGEAYGRFDLGRTETVTRRYATASPTPELDPAFDVRLRDADAGAPLLAPGESTVSVQGIPAWWLDTRVTEGMQLAFERDGYWFTIAGYRTSEEQVITAAEHTHLAPDGPSGGAVVDPAGLPDGVTVQLVGTEVELWLYPSGVTDEVVRTLSWVNGDRTAWLVSVPKNDDFVRMQRVPASTTADATVRGRPSFVATYETQTNLRWMAWTEADRSYLVASNNLSPDELAEFANALRPATVEEWTDALAAFEPDPDELAPVAVRYFPVIDETLVPDDGRGPTRGQYGQTEIDGGMVALPLLQVHGGVVGISVDPRPRDVLFDVYGGDFTATEVAGRPAFVDGRGAGRYLIDLGDGTTLVVESALLTRDELAPIAAAVQLVDRDTWEATYDPWPPIRDDSPPAPTTSPAETVAPVTDPVSAAPDVRELQQLLIERGFRPGPVDGVLGESTERAIWAAEKLYLGTPLEDVTGQPTPDLAAALTTNRGPDGTDPRTPRRSVPGAAHVEIDLPSQVMVVYDDDVPVLITHVSTGMLDDDGNPSEYCETATIDTDIDGYPLPAAEERSYCGLAKTPGGVFEVHRVVRGERHGPLGVMWDPIYFNMGIAIHGAVNVPMLPASHGGVRVPMHMLDHLHDLFPRGTAVYVWNGRQEPEDVSEADRMPIWDWLVPTTTP